METNPSVSGEELRVPEAVSTPKDVFLHLLMIVTLLMTVVSFTNLLFQYINVSFPDPLDYGDPYDGIRWATSVLIVAFPVFLWLSWLIEKEIQENPAKKDLKVRKWLIYLTLFVAAIAIIIDLMALIYNFYGGDITTRFTLKVLVVLAVAGTVFGYYLWDLRREKMDLIIPKRFAWVTATVVLISIIAGFFIAGSPAEQRASRFDTQRVGDLREIQTHIVNFWQQTERLPADLDELEDEVLGVILPADPLTGEDYEYKVINDLSFELCAEFQTAGRADDSRVTREVPIRDPFDTQSQVWTHEEGRHCFERTIDPERVRLHFEPNIER